MPKLCTLAESRTNTLNTGQTSTLDSVHGSWRQSTHTHTHIIHNTYIETDRQKYCLLAVFYHRSIPSRQRKAKIEIYSEPPSDFFAYGIEAQMEKWRENLGCSVGKLMDCVERSWNWPRFSVSTALTCTSTTRTVGSSTKVRKVCHWVDSLTKWKSIVNHVDRGSHDYAVPIF